MAQMRRWWYISAVMWMLAGSLPVGCMLTGCKGACGSMGTCGCSCRHACGGLADARRTLAVADSMRVNHGVAYDDSLALAEAYEVFARYRIVYPDDYARACYYYGRMLRNRGNHVGAMQAFISGTHAPYVQRAIPLPWFSDYHILGRIYSNMGTMCHLADQFQLSFEIYKQSAAAFEHIDSCISYYYALNDMAYELAELNHYSKTMELLHIIEDNCQDADVLNKTMETKARLYIISEQYDSVIFIAQKLSINSYYAATGYVAEAQAFWHMQRYDSARYYARLVMGHPYSSSKDKYNMLYILTYNDSTLDKEELQRYSEERADIDKEILDPLHLQLTQAVDILTNDMNNKPTFLHVVALMFLISLAAMTILVTQRRTHCEQAKQQHLQQQQNELIKKNSDLQRNNENLYQQYSERHNQIVRDIETTCSTLRMSENWQAELHWNNYNTFCEISNRLFCLLTTKLKVNYKLGEKEIRLCLLVLIGLKRNQIAELINYSKSGIGKYKDTIAKKIGTTGANLRKKLIEIAVK